MDQVGASAPRMPTRPRMMALTTIAAIVPAGNWPRPRPADVDVLVADGVVIALDPPEALPPDTVGIQHAGLCQDVSWRCCTCTCRSPM